MHTSQIFCDNASKQIPCTSAASESIHPSCLSMQLCFWVYMGFRSAPWSLHPWKRLPRDSSSCVKGGNERPQGPTLEASFRTGSHFMSTAGQGAEKGREAAAAHTATQGPRQQNTLTPCLLHSRAQNHPLVPHHEPWECRCAIRPIAQMEELRPEEVM